MPADTRQRYAHVLRQCRDAIGGTSFAVRSGGGSWPVRVEIEQAVPPGSFPAGKAANLRLGSDSINESLIEPGGLWSFWSRIGRPLAGNGFQESRAIVGGRLVGDVGGGLCQLSGLVHHLALLGALEIVERHPHSIDVYRESDRFAPLGSDATVVWGYKDLRLRNPHAFPVSITCTYDDDRVTARLRSQDQLTPVTVAFVTTDLEPGRVRVTTLVDGAAQNVTEYVQKPDMRVESTVT